MIKGSPPLAMNRRLEGVQLGRGLAATLVVVSHALIYATAGIGNFTQLFGTYGVTLFFVISGFIMVRTTGKGTFLPLAFMGKRIERIVPLYYIVMAIGMAQAIIAPQSFKTTTLEFWHVLRSFFFIPGYSPSFPGQHAITPFFKLGWTLNFEMFFYVIFASLFWLPSKTRVVVLTILFATLSTIGHFVKFDAAIPTYYTRIELIAFVTGGWLGLWHLHGRVRLSGAMAVAVTVVSIMLLYFVIARFDRGFVDDIPARLSLIAAATLHVWLMLGYLDREDVQVPALGRYLGDASYSLYLFHMFGIGIAKVILQKLFGPQLSLFAAIPAGICGMAAGLLAYHLLEKPIMDWFKQRRKSQAKRQSISLEPAPPVT